MTTNPSHAGWERAGSVDLQDEEEACAGCAVLQELSDGVSALRRQVTANQAAAVARAAQSQMVHSLQQRLEVAVQCLQQMMHSLQQSLQRRRAHSKGTMADS